MRFVILLVQIAVSSLAWTYAESGSDWGREFPLCKMGQFQSPIDLSEAGSRASDQLQLQGFGYINYGSASRTIFDTGNEICMPLDESGELQIQLPSGQLDYASPYQVTFRAPSEHSVDGRRHALEMQIWQRAPGSSFPTQAISIFFDPDSGGDAESDFLSQLPLTSVSRDKQRIFNQVALADFLGSLDYRRYWLYEGSMTQPPCTEGVKWVVLQKAEPISRQQLALFTRLRSDTEASGNVRAVQSGTGIELYFNSAALLSATLISVSVLLVI